MTQPSSDPPSDRDDQDEAQLVAERVDRNPAVDAAGAADEEQVLAELYGPADQYGVYRGTGA